MIVYSATKGDFLEAVRSNTIETQILDRFERNLGHSTSAREVESWRNSMQYMHNVLLDDAIPADAGVAIEYRIPQTSKRIDFILSGRDPDGRDSVVIVELKQWSEAHVTEKDAIVETMFGGSWVETSHPSYQAWSYAALLEDYNEAVHTGNIQLGPCAFLHNCADATALGDARYGAHLERAPLFLRHDTEKLARFIKTYVRSGDRGELIYRIENGRIRPSKNLADKLASMLAGNSEFLMIDDQKVVYEQALAMVEASQGGKKQVYIVKGGPGTGKSVVAVNLLVELTRRELNSQYITRNSAPREVYQAKLTGQMTKTRIANLFRSSGSFTKAGADDFDCLLVDEAHRLNEKSGMFRNQGENQVKELIHAARSTVFFLDEHQRVTIHDIGSVAEIRRWAEETGAVVHEGVLASQFRCNGSDGYLAWVDRTLQIEPTAVETLDDVDYEFRVCDSASELRRLIRQKNVEANKARMVAGYCWPWASKKDPGAMDIVLEDGEFEAPFEAQWNLSQDGMLWILQPDSVEQVGCIHTCQGLEVDYVGVILGPDLVVRDGVVVTDATERAGQDRSVHGFKKMHKADPAAAEALADEVVKNTYRTLMTRGQKGCFVYSVDPETNEWLRQAVGVGSTEPTTARPAPDALSVHPFPVVPPERLEPFVNAVPLYELEVAAGVFGSAQEAAEPVDWVELPDTFRLQPGMFVARVVGESMNKRIPSGSWCLFKAGVAGSRSGRIVLAQHRGVEDPETGGSFTVKMYESSYDLVDGERRGRVELVPVSTDGGFERLVFEDESLEGLEIVAEYVATVG